METFSHYWPCGRVTSQRAVLNILRPRPNGRCFADDIFKCIFLNENAWISLEISLKFVPKVRIDNIPALVQIMAWRRPGDKPLSEPMMVDLLTHICVTRPQWVKGGCFLWCAPGHRLNKRWSCWCFETPWCSCGVTVITFGWARSQLMKGFSKTKSNCDFRFAAMKSFDMIVYNIIWIWLIQSSVPYYSSNYIYVPEFRQSHAITSFVCNLHFYQSSPSSSVQ